jgi:uncharacterized protein YggE
MAMRNIILTGLLLASAILAYGQLDSNSVTITASRNLSVPADQAILSMSVTTPATTTLDEVLAALAGQGVTTANLTGASTDTSVTWNFTLSVPVSGLAATLNFLSNFQKNNAALQFTFSVAGAQASPAALAAQPCPFSDLFSDAQTQARDIAATMGRTIGPVLALTEGVPQRVPQTASGNVIPVALISSFRIGYNTPQTIPCSIAVKFALR